MNTLSGNDISQFQGPNVDMNKLRAEGKFVSIRCNFGSPDSATSLNVDTEFYHNRDFARQAGVMHFFTHYAYPEYNSPEAEADFVGKLLSDMQNNEGFALDFEESKFTGDYDDWTYRFFVRLATYFHGYMGIFYSYLAMINAHSWTKTLSLNVGLWLADWDGNPNTIPNTPWPVVAFKQYTDKSSDPAIPTNVDADIFYGDETTFDKYMYHPPVIAPTSPAPSTVHFKIYWKKTDGTWGTFYDAQDGDDHSNPMWNDIKNAVQAKYIEVQREINGTVVEDIKLDEQSDLITATNSIVTPLNQKIADLQTNNKELQGQVADYENTTIPELKSAQAKEVSDLNGQINDQQKEILRLQELVPTTPQKTTPMVNDPNINFWVMTFEQALKTYGGFISEEIHKLFHR